MKNVDMFANHALLAQVSEQAKALSRARVAPLRETISKEEARLAEELKGFEAEHDAIATSIGIEGWAELAGVEAIPTDEGAYLVRQKGADWALLLAGPKWERDICKTVRLVARQGDAVLKHPFGIICPGLKNAEVAVRAGITLTLIGCQPHGDVDHRVKRLPAYLLGTGDSDRDQSIRLWVDDEGLKTLRDPQKTWIEVG